MRDDDATDEETTDQYSSTSSGGTGSVTVPEDQVARPTNLIHRWNSEIHKIKDRIDRQLYSVVKRTQDHVDSVFTCQHRQHAPLESSDDGFTSEDNEMTKKRLLFMQRRKMLRRKQAAAKRYPIQVSPVSKSIDDQVGTFLQFDPIAKRNITVASPRSHRSEKTSRSGKTARSTSDRTTPLSNLSKHVELRRLQKDASVNFEIIEAQDDTNDAFPLSTVVNPAEICVMATELTPTARTPTVQELSPPEQGLQQLPAQIVSTENKEGPETASYGSRDSPIVLERLSADSIGPASSCSSPSQRDSDSAEPLDSAVRPETKLSPRIFSSDRSIDQMICASKSHDLSSAELPSLAFWRQNSGAGLDKIDSFPALFVKRTMDDKSVLPFSVTDDLNSRKAPDPEGEIPFVHRVDRDCPPSQDEEVVVTDDCALHRLAADKAQQPELDETEDRMEQNVDNRQMVDRHAVAPTGYKSPLFGLPENLSNAKQNHKQLAAQASNAMAREISESKKFCGFGKPEDQHPGFEDCGAWETAEIHLKEIRECTSELTWHTDDHPPLAVLMKKDCLAVESNDASDIRTRDNLESITQEIVSQFEEETPRKEQKCPDRSIQPRKSSQLRYAKEMPLVDPKGDHGLYTGILVCETPSSFGEMNYTKNRQKYKGTWEKGMWNGYGRIVFANGDTYTGQFVDDVREGSGRYCWADGRRYDGSFVKDKREGIGTYSWPNGSVYAGSFRDGLRHGSGTLTFPDGSVYRGEWANGKQNGKGECVWHDGRYYIGQWKEGRVHGLGVEVRRDGTVRHDGEWKNDRPVRPLNNNRVKNRKT